MKTNDLLKLLTAVGESDIALSKENEVLLEEAIDFAVNHKSPYSELAGLMPLLDLPSRDGKHPFTAWNEDIVAYFISEDMMMCNSRKYLNNKGEVQGETIVLFIIVSDTFYYASADAEPISYKELLPLYLLYREHGYIGITHWAVEKRGQLPLERYCKELKEAGLWTEEMQLLENRAEGKL